MRGNKEQITLTLPPETLTRLERAARDRGMTRAGLLNLLIHEGLSDIEDRSRRSAPPPLSDHVPSFRRPAA